MEVLVIVDRPFFGVWFGRRGEHAAHLFRNLVRVGDIDPCPVQAAIIVGGKAGHVDAGTARCVERGSWSSVIIGCELVSHVSLLCAARLSFPHQAGVGGEKVLSRSVTGRRARGWP